MRDHDGVEWLPVAQAAERFRIRASLIYRWIGLGRVTTWPGPGVALVRMPDVMAVEYAWYTRRKGHRRHADTVVLDMAARGE